MGTNRFSAWSDLGVLTAIFFAATLIAGACMAAVMVSHPDMERELFMFIAYTAQFSLAVAGGVIWSRYNGGGRIRLGADWSAGPMIVLGIVLVTAASIALEPLIDLFPEHYLEKLNGMIGSGGWAVMLTVVAAPVLEEIFFRGIVLESLSRRWNSTAAVVASAALFGAAHLPILPQMVNAFVIAVMMGFIYLATRSLLPVIAIHAVNNGIAYMMLQLTGTQNTSTRDLVGNDALYWVVYGASSVVFILSVILMAVKTNNKTPKTALKSNDG